MTHTNTSTLLLSTNSSRASSTVEEDHEPPPTSSPPAAPLHISRPEMAGTSPGAEWRANSPEMRVSTLCTALDCRSRSMQEESTTATPQGTPQAIPQTDATCLLHLSLPPLSTSRCLWLDRAQHACYIVDDGRVAAQHLPLARFQHKGLTEVVTDDAACLLH